MKGLTNGRIVHYIDSTGNHLAAIVTRVWDEDGTVNLYVFPDDSYLPVDGWFPLSDYQIHQKTKVKFAEQCKPFCWHWIEQA